MTEETNQTATESTSTSNSTSTNKSTDTEPDWFKKTNELKEEIGANSEWKQIAYLSNDQEDCEVIQLSEKHDATLYPVVLEEPTGLVHPKYDWSKSEWIEQDTQSQGYRLNQAEEKITNLQNSYDNSVKSEADKDETIATLQNQVKQNQMFAAQTTDALSTFGTNMNKLANAVNKLTDTSTDTSTTNGGEK